MAGITLAQAEAQLALWLSCLESIATNGQSVTIGPRTFTAGDLKTVQAQVEFWDGKVKALSANRSGMRIRGITPV